MEKQIYKEVILDLLDENEINSIKNRFYLLMGYDLEIYNKYKEEFNKLSDIYMFLSRVIIKDSYEKSYRYFCDFKSFFMFYDVFLVSKKCNVSRLIYLLTDSFNEIVSELDENKRYIVKEVDDYLYVNKIALKFIREYARLDLKIKNENGYDPKTKIINSYNANQGNLDTHINNSEVMLPKFGNKFVKKYSSIIGNN